MTTDPMATTLEVVAVLDQLHIPYLIGGSLASAVHGVVRATRDADIVVDIQRHHATPLVQQLQARFYVQLADIHDAIQQGSSFNLVHFTTFFKIDMFVFKGRPFDHAQFARRTEQTITLEPEQMVYLASAEDTILTKLEWYRLGNEVSERQWTDVLGVLKVQGQQLDRTYLQQWATDLHIVDLLERAYTEAGLT